MEKINLETYFYLLISTYSILLCNYIVSLNFYFNKFDKNVSNNFKK